jgi:hypothetical protein
MTSSFFIALSTVLFSVLGFAAGDYSQDVDSLVQLAFNNDASSFLPLEMAKTFYSTQSTVVKQVNGAMSIHGSQFITSFQNVNTGMCTTATVMAFLSEISRLQTEKKIQLMPETLQALKLSGADGFGFWGRWNADGPGTALLFQDYSLGSNFQDIKNAKTGDFMKIFWNDRMGEVPGNPQSVNNEHGHSVIFEGIDEINGVWYVRYWSDNSSNTAGFPDTIGFKMKYRKLSDVKHAIFSRLEHPENLDRITQAGLPKVNGFLAHLPSQSYSYAEGIEASGLRFADDEAE